MSMSVISIIGKACAVFCFTCFFCFQIQAQFSLLKDINPTLDDQMYDQFYNKVELNGVVYFVSGDSGLYDQLWRTDGTAAGTYLVKDINMSSYESSSLNYLTKMNNAIYFAANDGTGAELWKSDGTNAGTYMLKRTNPTYNINCAGNPMDLVVCGNTLYFSANDYSTPNVYNRELWKSDGTAAGTVKVKEINPSLSEGADLQNMINLNGTLYFTAKENSSGGADLWKSDGTAAGTVKVYDFTNNGSFAFTVVGKNKFYWIMSEGGYGSEPWVSDGTTSGTHVIDLSQGAASSFVREIIPFGDSLVISASVSGTTPTYGYELWISDGTINNKTLVKDIVVGGHSYPQSLYVMENNLYFIAEVSSYYEVWKSDLTTPGTIKLKQFGSINGSYGAPDNFTEFNNKLIFTSQQSYFSSGGTYLPNNVFWQSDGTAAGTINLNLPPYNPGDLFVLNSQLLFRATPTQNAPHGISLWVTDGTPGGTSVVKDIDIGARGIDFGAPMKMNDSLFYPIDNSGIWASNGTSAGTFLYNQAETYFYNARFLNYKGTILFEDGRFLKSDGTIGNIKMPAGGYFPTYITIINDYIFYTCSGVTSKVYSVNDLYSEPVAVTLTGTTNNSVLNMKAVGGMLFMNVSSEGCYRYVPGSAAATAFAPGAIDDIVAYNGTIYFADVFDRLSKFNGSSVQQLTWFYSEMTQLTPCNNTLYFYGSNGTDATAGLWKYEGTTETMVKGGIKPTSITAVNGLVFFVARTNDTGYELWKSNGTTAGTTMVKEINPGRASSYPSDFYVLNNILYFAASDPISGNELWRTDGTASGTYMVADINPGNGGSYPTKFIDLSNELVVLAKHPSYGSELWKVTLPAPNVPSNLNATGGDHAISLDWSSDNNLVSRFEIYRATSDKQFVKLTEVASGTYSFLDENTQSGILYYYKVRAVYDVGGNSAYSNVSSAQLGSTTPLIGKVDQTIELFPNPASESLTVKSESQYRSIIVQDILGNTCLNFSNLGTSAFQELNISQLSTGIYFVKIENNKGTSVFKIFKK